MGSTATSRNEGCCHVDPSLQWIYIRRRYLQLFITLKRDRLELSTWWKEGLSTLVHPPKLRNEFCARDLENFFFSIADALTIIFEILSHRVESIERQVKKKMMASAASRYYCSVLYCSTAPFMVTFPSWKKKDRTFIISSDTESTALPRKKGRRHQVWWSHSFSVSCENHNRMWIFV